MIVAQGYSLDSLGDVARSHTDLDHPMGTADLRQVQQNRLQDATYHNFVQWVRALCEILRRQKIR